MLFKRLALFPILAVLLLFPVHLCDAAPQLIITNLPAYGSFDDLAGVVIDADPVSNAIAIFIYVPNYGWVSKPTCDQPLTPIQPDGSWSADITTGGSDQLATRIAALLVQTNYSEMCVDGSAFLPTNVFSRAIASAIVTRPYPGPRWLTFSGYDWLVKASSSPAGPGPNYFSDNTNNVFVDEQGQLHLRITNRSNQWQCAEILSARTFGFGNYRFELASQVDNLSPTVVLGLFTYSDDPVYADREIDVECSRWGNAADTNNSQYVVQPSDACGHLVRFDVPAIITHSTHLFIWESNQVAFQSVVGSYNRDALSTNLISSYTYSSETPQTGDENVHMNLWLYHGTAPANNQETEIIIKSFNFVPLASAKPATLNHPRRSASGQFQMELHGNADWRYEIDGSTNAVDWETLSTVLSTNTVMSFADTNAAAFGSRFYQAKTLP